MNHSNKVLAQKKSTSHCNELTFKSESENQLAVSHGSFINNMHFKVKPKNTEIKRIQTFNCQKWTKTCSQSVQLPSHQCYEWL